MQATWFQKLCKRQLDLRSNNTVATVIQSRLLEHETCWRPSPGTTGLDPFTMGRFGRFDPKASDFVTPKQQAANFQTANQQKRAPRPNLKPPTVRHKGQKRKHTQEPNLPLDDEQTAGAGGSKDRQAGSSKWEERNRRREKAWSDLREKNSQSVLQYQTLLAGDIQLLQIAAAEHCALTAVCRAVLLHPCLMGYLGTSELASLENSLLSQLEAVIGGRTQPSPEQQEQQQGPSPQQQQQQEPLPQEQEGSVPQQQQQQAQSIQIVATRLVSCHTLGVSFWLPVPTVKCRCCETVWEEQPAAAGYFGSSPKQPWAWFSQNLLDFYTPLCTAAGCSITNMAAAIAKGNVQPRDAEIKVDAR